MTREYSIKYDFDSYWTPIRAKNIIKHLNIKCSNFDEHMRIISCKYKCDCRKMQNKIHPYDVYIKLFPESNYFFYSEIRNRIAEKELPYEVKRRISYSDIKMHMAETYILRNLEM